MTTFAFGLFSGLPLTMWLSTLPTPTLQAIFGCLAGTALALAAIYLYLLTQRDGYHVYRKPVMQPRRSAQRKPAQQRYPASWPLTGAYALAGGAA